MSTPTFVLPPPSAEAIAKALQDELRRRQEATPEPIFDDPEPEQCFDLFCKIERNRFTPNEVDDLRAGITEPGYWECEARHLREQLSSVMWNNILREHTTSEKLGVDGWRSVATAYAHLLRQNGCSVRQQRENRFTIPAQEYWKPEAERLRSVAALREQEMREAYWAQNDKSQGFPSPAESHSMETSRSEVKPSRRSERVRQRQKSKSGDDLASQRVIESTAKITKSRGKVGSKSRSKSSRKR